MNPTRLSSYERAAEAAVRALGGSERAVETLRETIDHAEPLKPDEEVVGRVVRRYVRRSQWASLVAKDLAQEGHAALAEARRRFEPEKGEWEGYAYRAAWLAIASYLVAESSPVTRREKGAANLARRAPEEALLGFISTADTEEAFGEAEWREKVRERLLALTGDEGVARVLLEETTPARLAKERDVPVSRIYGLVSSARSRLAADSALYALMQAKKGVGFPPCP